MPDGKKIVLVVDAAKLSRTHTCSLLTRGGLTVVEADSNESAVAILRDRHVALVVCDVASPAIDGFQLLAWVKNSQSGVRVMFMGPRGDAALMSKAHAAGADGWLGKPIHGDQMVDAVTKTLGA